MLTSKQPVSTHDESHARTWKHMFVEKSMDVMCKCLKKMESKYLTRSSPKTCSPCDWVVFQKPFPRVLPFSIPHLQPNCPSFSPLTLLPSLFSTSFPSSYITPPKLHQHTPIQTPLQHYYTKPPLPPSDPASSQSPPSPPSSQALISCSSLRSPHTVRTA